MAFRARKVSGTFEKRAPGTFCSFKLKEIQKKNKSLQSIENEHHNAKVLLSSFHSNGHFWVSSIWYSTLNSTTGMNTQGFFIHRPKR